MIFQKKTVEDLQFDIGYFRNLCNEKRRLENRIEIMDLKDVEVTELLEDRLRVINKEINIIVTQEKENRGDYTHGPNYKYIIQNGKKIDNPNYNREILKNKAEDRKPLFVNGDLIIV